MPSSHITSHSLKGGHVPKKNASSRSHPQPIALQLGAGPLKPHPWEFDCSGLCGSFAGNHSYCELMSAMSRRQQFTAFLPILGSYILSNPSYTIFPEPEEDLIQMCHLGLRRIHMVSALRPVVSLQ